MSRLLIWGVRQSVQQLVEHGWLHSQQVPELALIFYSELLVSHNNHSPVFSRSMATPASSLSSYSISSVLNQVGQHNTISKLHIVQL